MPYKSEKIKLSEAQDRRRKLTEDTKEIIRNQYATGMYSLNSLAKEYGVSKKLILITVNPESNRKSEAYIREHWKDYTRTKLERRTAAKNTRRYKQELYLKGELKETKMEDK